MALLKTDWSVAANGNIRSVANSTTHAVLELHRFLMGLLDDSASSGDDLLDVTAGIIPSTRSTDQIITLNSPYNIDDAAAQRFYNGSITQDGGDTLYSGLQVVGSTYSTTALQIVQDNALLTSFWGNCLNVDASKNILLQILVKTRASGADIDGKRIRVQARTLGDTYAYFNVELGLAVGVAAITTGKDDFNQTVEGTIAGWTDIVNTPEGYQPLDVDGNGANEYYYSQWDKASRTTNNLYERGKWATRRGTSETLYGMNGELFLGITHSFNYDNELSGPFAQNDALSWGTGATAGTGVLLGLLDSGAVGTMWIQLTTGVPPIADMQITNLTATCDVNGAVSSRTVNGNCFLGSYTGSLTGAYGVGVQPSDLIAADSLRALDDVARNPPNNVNIVITGVASGDILFSCKTKTHSTTVSGVHGLGDTTLALASGIPVAYNTVGRIVINAKEHVYTAFSGTDVTIAAPGLQEALSGGEAVTVTQADNKAFTCDTAAGTYNDVGDTVIQFTTTIGSAWPTAGKVRVFNTANGWYEVYSYTAISGQQLTGISPALSRDISTEFAYIPFVDEAASGDTITKTIVYPGSAVAGRHRLYNSASNIKPFEVPFSVGAAGASSQMVRGSDA
jgi:hypothetical protein